MGHRAKHLRRNWIPARLAAADERAKKEQERLAELAKAKEAKQGGDFKWPDGVTGAKVALP